MATFRKVRELLLTRFDDGDISEYEFLLFYDVNRSKNPDFPHQNYGHFDLKRLDESESKENQSGLSHVCVHVYMYNMPPNSSINLS